MSIPLNSSIGRERFTCMLYCSYCTNNISYSLADIERLICHQKEERVYLSQSRIERIH